MGISCGSHLPGSADGMLMHSRPAVRALAVPAGSWRLGHVDGRPGIPGRTCGESAMPILEESAVLVTFWTVFQSEG